MRVQLGFWLGLIAGPILIEAGYRADLYYEYAVNPAPFPVTVVDRIPANDWINTPNNVHGRFDPGVTTYSNFSVEGKLYSRNRITANNMGWVSRFDYSVAKQPGEYRIAVIGDSFVASTTNETPWTDILQPILNSDPEIGSAVGSSSVTVMSFGLGGAPISRIGGELFDVAKRYDADLIVFNIIQATLDRPFRPLKPASSRDFTVKPVDPRPAAPIDFEIDGIEFRLFCYPPRSLANPDCHVNPLWLARGEPDIGEARVQSTKRKLARETMWERVVTRPYPLIALELTGRPPVARPAAHAAAASSEAAGLSTKVAQTLEAFDTLRRIHPNIMFTNALTYQQMRDRDPVRLERLKQLVADGAAKNIRVVDMRQHLPKGQSAAEIKSWYQVPNDGHFSDKGAAIYAEAMHQAIRQHLGLPRLTDLD